MSRSRTPAVLALAFTLLGAISVMAVADPASAATDTITIVSAGNPPGPVGSQSNDAGDLTVVADSTTPITSLTVRLSGASNPDVMDPAMTRAKQIPLPNGVYQSIWTVTTPIPVGTPPAGLALGDYTVSVNATDAGTTQSFTDAGTLQFLDLLALTIGANHTVLSYDDPTVTVSGTATALSPGATTPAPYANQQIDLLIGSAGVIPLETDNNGNYTYTYTPNGADSVRAYLDPTATTFYGSSAAIGFTVHYDPVQLTAHLSARTITYGTKVTLSGTLLYEPRTTYAPFPNQKVEIYNSQNVNSPVATVTTDAKGNFSLVLPTVGYGLTWVLQAGGAVTGPYLHPATASLPMTVDLSTAITSFRATLSQYWQVSFSGCLGLARLVPNVAINSAAGLTIQYSAGTPNGPWRTLTKSLQLGARCGTSGVWFSGKANAQDNYAYYRAYYPGGTAFDETYLSSASKKVLAWKYDDRITSFSVSPRVAARGGKLTVKGQLQYYYGRWRNFGGQQVLIILRPKGSGTWYWIVKVKTSSSGRFTAIFTDPVSATWSAEYIGSPAHLAAIAPLVYARLKG